jgi:hydrogenase expression/formation protein HypC
MCLAVPGKLIEIYEVAGMKMGKIDYSGTINQACLEYVPEIEVGQYTVVHAGFALSVINEEEAALSYETWRQYNESARREGSYEFGPTADDGKQSGE